VDAQSGHLKSAVAAATAQRRNVFEGRTTDFCCIRAAKGACQVKLPHTIEFDMTRIRDWYTNYPLYHCRILVSKNQLASG
jgi:hypothetical protein